MENVKYIKAEAIRKKQVNTVIIDCDECEEFSPESLPSISEGYIPHEGMGLFRCSACGGTVFECFAQSVPLDAPVWTYEHYCVNCGKMMGLTIRRESE